MYKNLLIVLIIVFQIQVNQIKAEDNDTQSPEFQKELETLCHLLSPTSDIPQANPEIIEKKKSLQNDPLYNVGWWPFSSKPEDTSFNYEDILALEERLNQKVLQQTNATHAVASSILIFTAGFKEKNAPVGAFLFLGPTGVGKTELAKVLTKEVYKDINKMIRFDMSHFSEPHSVSRLIGSPPGYINSWDGGQLTNPLQNNPRRVVLLDEIEKSDPAVRKLFLPIFDEGFLYDAKNRYTDCTQAIFIMTSNLCGPEIIELSNLGLSSEEILSYIEPKLMMELSPELYNRVEPVIFHPLKQETMKNLVELMISELIIRVRNEKKIELTVDEKLKTYLEKKGYHPLLGARPLKKLIEKKVVAELAYSILSDQLEQGSQITMSYDESEDAVIIIFEH